MANKILFVATVDLHIIAFHIPYLQFFKEKGWEVHVASSGSLEIPFCDNKFNIPFSRFPYSKANLNAYKSLKCIINEANYQIIHCHTPVGGALTRFAAKKARKNGTKVIYTAHGFHFFKGAPLQNWFLYYPIEHWLAKHTDCLITINDEDYDRAKRKFKVKRVEKVNGVGIDLNKFRPQTKGIKLELRKEYNYTNDDFIMIFVGELNTNKNQKQLINSMDLLKEELPNLKLLLVGDGPLRESYEALIKELRLENIVKLLGYRKDIPNLMALADLALSSSRREGLPVNVMEAMAAGLPLIVTDVRGNRDLVRDGENGYVVEIDKPECFADAIRWLYNSEDLRRDFGKRSLELIEIYSLPNILQTMKAVYQEFLS